MIETICYASIMVVEAMIAWFYCERLFDRKRKVWSLALAYTIGYTILFLISLRVNAMINSVSFGIINCVLFIYGYRIKCRNAFLHAAFLCFIMLIAEVLVSLVINFFGYDFTEYTHNVAIMILLSFWSKLLYLIIAVLCTRLFSHNKYVDDEPRFFAVFCVLPIASAILAAVIIYFGMHSEVNQTTSTMMTIFIAALLIINLVFLSLYNHIQKMYLEQLQTQLVMQKEENDALYYQTLQEQSDSQRILIHDIKNHMHALKQLAEQGKLQAVAEYLGQIDKTVLSIPKTRLCDEPVLNILLLRFADDCKKKGVGFSCDIRDIYLGFMDATSITALFGNLLSNALEAAEISQAKTVEIDVRCGDNQGAITIFVCNSCDVTPIPDLSGMYISSKNDRRKHGVGLKSIQRIVKKYKGVSAAQYLEEKREFHHIIHIPKQEAKQN